MQALQTAEQVGEELCTFLGMTHRPVGIKLHRKPVDDHRKLEKPLYFCRTVREAASGKDFLITIDDEGCADAEVVLGFRESKLVDLEPRIKDSTIHAVSIGPLDNAEVVLLILNPEQAMTVAHLLGGVDAHFSGNLSVCGEAVAKVVNEGKANVSFLCEGARFYGQYEPQEVVLSLPYEAFLQLPERMAKFSSLSHKAREGLKQLFLRMGR